MNWVLYVLDMGKTNHVEIQKGRDRAPRKHLQVLCGYCTGGKQYQEELSARCRFMRVTLAVSKAGERSCHYLHGDARLRLKLKNTPVKDGGNGK